MKNNYVLQFPQIAMSRFRIVNPSDAKEHSVIFYLFSKRRIFVSGNKKIGLLNGPLLKSTQLNFPAHMLGTAGTREVLLLMRKAGESPKWQNLITLSHL